MAPRPAKPIKKLTEPIKPDRQDFEALDAEHGRLPDNSSDAEMGERYRLAQAAKLIRLYEQGKLPLSLMRHMDAIARREKARRRKP